MASVEVPNELRRAQERDFCKYRPAHWWVSVDPMPPGTYARIFIYPFYPRYLLKNFAVSYGPLEPAGTSPDFVIYHYARGLLLHYHYYLHGVIQHTYPLTNVITATEPHELWIGNWTGVMQQFDMIFHRMEFLTEEDWDRYRAMIEEPHSMLEELRKIRREIEQLREEIIPPVIAPPTLAPLAIDPSAIDPPPVDPPPRRRMR